MLASGTASFDDPWDRLKTCFPMNSDNAVIALSALAQHTRLSIYRLLVVAGSAGIAVGKIGQELSLPPATLSFHLKELAHAGLITGTQDGKFVFYRANFARMNELLGFLAEHCCDGNQCELSVPVCLAAREDGPKAPADKLSA